MTKLIIAPVIDWSTYTNELREYSISKNTNSRLNVYENFLITLANISNRTNRPLAHLNFTFLCSLEEDIFYKFVILEKDIDITICKGDIDIRNSNIVFILTIHIKRIKDLITVFMIKDVDNRIRVFLNEIYNIMISLGFKELFQDYRAIKMIDGSVYMEKK